MIFINTVLFFFIVSSANNLISWVDSKNLKEPNNYKLIDSSKKNEIIKYKNLIPKISCVNDFVTSYLNHQTTRITVILNKHDIISNTYLKELQKSCSTSVLTESYNVNNKKHKTTLNVVILLKHHHDLGDLQIKINEIGGLGCTYTVLLIDHFENENLFIKESNILIKLLWIKKKMANIVIIGFVKDHYLAMKSNEFKPNILREPMDPVIVGECQNKKWITTSTLFGPMKMNNCSVNVGYLDNEPYVHAVEKQNSLEYIGIDLPILRVIANHLNFTVNLSEMEGSKNIMKTDKVARSLRSNRSYDIIIGGITWQPKDDIDYTVSYEVVQLVFLVPVVQTGGVSFLALISPLDKSVWIAIMIVLSFAIFLKFIVFYKISFLEITAVIIGVAWNKQPMIFSYRILFMSWVIFGYILTQYYLASMPGRLLAKTDNKIDTIKDLINSRISRGGLKNTKIFFIGNKTFDNKLNSNELIYQVFENYHGFERIEYEKKLQDLISGKNKTMALSALMNSSSIPTKFDSRILRILPEALTSFPLGFPVWRGLPYLNDIDKDLQILIESGIISHFGNIETKHVFSKENNDGKISDEYIKLNDLVPGFLILGIGYVVGLIFFFFEIMISRVK